jgi:DNA-binding winged helix-turn-helix (wHTH) protein
VLDPDRRELARGSEIVSISPKAFDLLVHLVRNREHVVSKDDLLQAVWEGRIVSESTLTSHINAVRKAIGDSGEEQRLIRTLARKGFRFVGEVVELQPSDDVRPAVSQSQRRPRAGVFR